MRTIPYTLRSFIELVESENRQGKDISRLDPEVKKATRALHERREQFLKAISQINKDDPARDGIRETYRQDRRKLREIRDQAIEDALHHALSTFESKLNQDQFTFELKVGKTVKGKPTYQISPAFDVTFPAKQASEVLKRAAFIETPGRNSIVRALKATLKKKYSHVIYRIDIKNFFESISHSILVERISKYSTLDSVSLELVCRLLTEYEQINGTSAGVPRGVGLSSQLAELYLAGFDSVVKAHPGVLFYARYVDDIIIVLENEKFLIEAEKVIDYELSSLQLELSQKKTCKLIAGENGAYENDEVIEYLGYRFRRDATKLITGLTDKRKNRRNRRLKLALEAWLRTSPNAMHPNHGHDGLLLDRVRYLAGNTQLLNSKSNVAIGLYFSNSALDAEAEELSDLDNILDEFRGQNAWKMSDKLKNRLSEVSFVDMFENRTFLRFRTKRIDQIVKVWKGVSDEVS